MIRIAAVAGIVAVTTLAQSTAAQAAQPPLPVVSAPANGGTMAPTAIPAAPPDRGAETTRGSAVPAQDWRMAGYIGGFGSDRTGGATLGTTFQYRYELLVAGALAEFGGGVLDSSYVGAGALLGLGLRPTRNVRLDLLGVVGARSYSGVGRGLLSSDPGAKGSTAYAGGRLGVSYLFGRNVNHFELGAYGTVEDDLSRQRSNYDYPATGDGWFDGGGRADHDIGWYRLGFGLEIGGSHDIL